MRSLRDTVESVLVRRELELEEITQTKAGSRSIVRITIDGDGSQGRGLNLDEVAEVSQEISRVLDDTNVMGSTPYVLEVGTPGVDRPLVTPAHWRRNIGRLVTVNRYDQEPLTARILSVSDDEVTLSGDLRVQYSTIKKAVVQVEMNRDEEEKDEAESWT